jgi:hypothetical protein
MKIGNGLAIILISLMMHSSLLHAAMIINVNESGGDVIASANGSINTAALTEYGGGGVAGGSTYGSGYQAYYDGVLVVSTQVAHFTPYIINTTIAFSTGASIFRATTNSGSTIGITSHGTAGYDRLYVPDNYVSNTPITASSTWSGTTIAGLGLIPGTYVVTWGSGETADSLTINIDESEPASTYSVGGTVSGLTGSVTLQNNGGDDIIKTTNDGFTFPAQAEGSDYAVTVSSQPTGQTCSVTGGDNSLGGGAIAGADVTSVAVTCVTDEVPTYTVGGNVSGLTGSVTLQNNVGDDIIKTTNDGFTFTAQAEGTDYVVTVSSQPSGQTCTVGNGSGTNITANITNVSVACVTDVVPTYSVGGTVSGLTGTGLALQNNGTEILSIAADGSFTFLTELVDTTAYTVIVSTQPTDQICTVTNGSGAIAVADVTNVSVACANVVAPPPVPMVPIPTLSQWALILLTMLIGLMVFANKRRLF